MTRAVRHVHSGDSQAAFDTLRKAQQISNRPGGLLDAMLAYSCIGLGDNGGAEDACNRVLAAKRPPSTDGEYVKQYCRYLCAVLANDYRDYAEQRKKLQRMARSRLIDDALRVDQLLVRDHELHRLTREAKVSAMGRKQTSDG